MDDQPLLSRPVDDLLPSGPARGNGGDGRAGRPGPPSRASSRLPPAVDSGWAPSRWWQFGLLGGVVLSYATGIKFVRALRRGGAADVDWNELPGFAAMLFGAGFLCGAIVWAGRGLYHRFGPVGDAIVGLAVMVAFFTSVMLASEPALLGDKFATGGGPMLGFAAALGPLAGVWIGRDLRKKYGAG